MFTGFLAVEESQSSSDYRPKAVALLPWWKAGTVCLWPPKNNWIGNGLTDILLCSLFLDTEDGCLWGINSPQTAV